eukprot:CAMPEP_0204068428 /NCGR_PEP_ID=MMETSP0360-20130528/155304_1 /ASSEMBLY_ACC=CAM_ASM_000342 /TAXON_ID=268821 /ORGANISM="Scrippsiella Hangoei, Strain SHTV-5" /LENGTH=125 /DNA_ID=CAMNT_0051016557 /DNA_START=40 /DNA_END=413 /DNA_ORIENTATION=-
MPTAASSVRCSECSDGDEWHGLGQVEGACQLAEHFRERVLGAALALANFEGEGVGAWTPDHGEVPRLVVLNRQLHAERRGARGDALVEHEALRDRRRDWAVDADVEFAQAGGIDDIQRNCQLHIL